MATTPLYALTDTWDTTATTYAGLSLSVTDSASAAGSLLMDLQVGSASKFKVDKTGSIYPQSEIKPISGTLIMRPGNGSGTWYDGLALSTFQLECLVATTKTRALTIGTSTSVNTNSTLISDDAHTLAQRNGANAQTTRVYSTYTAADNFQRLAITSASATLSGLSGASVTATALIPVGAVVVGVTTRVGTLITGATGYQVGTAADPDRWGDITGTAVGTTSDNANWTAGTIECFTAATDVIITAKTSNFTAGALTVTVHYLAGQAD